MNAFLSALWAEMLKARRSKVSLLTAAGFSLLPVVGGLFMYIQKDPERARAMGLIGAKAELLTGGAAEWRTYLEFLSLGTAGGGAILFAFILAWVFGREYSDHTAKELLAIPTPREVIVGAKLVFSGLWILGLTLMIFVMSLGIGGILGLPGWSHELVCTSGRSLVIIALLTFMLMPFVSLIASAGRGYLAPLGWAFLTLALSQVAGLMGWGDWFPWSVPGLYGLMFSKVYGQGAQQPGFHSLVLVFLTCLVGTAATFAWWRNADQARW